MDAKEFREYMLKKSEKDYGICPPPLDAQEGLSILIAHFLGEDWYTTLPICQKQVNTEAVYEILCNYPNKGFLGNMIIKIKRAFRPN